MRTGENSSSNESLQSIAERVDSRANILEKWARRGNVKLSKRHGSYYINASALMDYLEKLDYDKTTMSAAMSSTRRAQRKVLNILKRQDEKKPDAEYVSMVCAIDSLARSLDVYHQEAFGIILENPQAMIEKNGIPYVKKNNLEAMMGK